MRNNDLTFLGWIPNSNMNDFFEGKKEFYIEVELDFGRNTDESAMRFFVLYCDLKGLSKYATANYDSGKKSAHLPNVIIVNEYRRVHLENTIYELTNEISSIASKSEALGYLHSNFTYIPL